MSSQVGTAPPAAAAGGRFRDIERLLVCASFVTSLGNSIQLTAAAIVIVQASQSMIAVGWVFVAFSAPPVVLSLLFGRLADRFDRRALCIGCDLASAALAAALPTWLLLGGSPTIGIYAATFGLSAISALFLPASNALIKERVADERLGPFNAHFEMGLQAGTLLSTAIGGVLVQWYGAEPLFYFNAVTFLLSAALFVAMGRRPAGAVASETVGASAGGGTGDRPLLTKLGLLYALGNPIITVSNTLLVVLVIHTFRQGAGVLGVVDALAGVGFFLAAALYKLLNRRASNLHVALLGYAACAVFILLQPRFGVPGLMLLLPLGTVTFGVARIACRTMLMRAAPEHRAGRIFGATNAFGLAFSVAATVAVSAVSDRTAVRHGFASLAALIVCVAGVTIAVLWPARARLENRKGRTS